MTDSESWIIPSRLYLYKDESTSVLNADEIADYLRETIGVDVEVRGDFIRHHFRGDLDELAGKLASIRVHDISKPFKAEEPQYGLIMFEKRFLEEPTKKIPGVLYDGNQLMKILREMLPEQEKTMNMLHIMFTSRLFGTYQEDGRYHAHVNICVCPSIVSTSGIVEAPAKPKGYYVLKQRLASVGDTVPIEVLKEQFSGQFIDYDDPNLTEVLKGYALQCIVYNVTGEAFCTEPKCRLYNAHWQSEVIKAQLESKSLCEKHTDVTKEIRKAIAK